MFEVRPGASPFAFSLPPHISPCLCAPGSPKNLLGSELSGYVSRLASSHACWAGCCHCPACFQLSPHSFPRALAGLDEVVWLSQSLGFSCLLNAVTGWPGLVAITRWSGLSSTVAGSVTSLCPPTLASSCLHLLLGWTLSRDGRWSGSVSSLSPTCPRFFPHALAGLDWMLSQTADSVRPVSPHLLLACHDMVWLGQTFPSQTWSLFVFSLVCICLHTCFLTRLLGWTLFQDGLAGLPSRYPGPARSTRSSCLTRLFAMRSPLDTLARLK